MPLGDICIHPCVPFGVVDGTDFSWGEATEQTPTDGTPFFGFLQLVNSGGEEADAKIGKRKVKRPTLKYEPYAFDESGNAVSGLTAEDLVKVTAEELTGPNPVVWQVVGDPVPYSPPGDVIGYEAQLRRVEDG